MNFVRMLLEQRDVLKKSNQLSFLWEKEKIFYAFDKSGNMVVCREE